MRQSLDYVLHRVRKAVAAELKPVCRAPNRGRSGGSATGIRGKPVRSPLPNDRSHLAPALGVPAASLRLPALKARH